MASAVVCTDVFHGSANAIATIRGFPGYRYVAVEHPVASRTTEELEEMSKRFVDEVAEVLGAAPTDARASEGGKHVDNR